MRRILIPLIYAVFTSVSMQAQSGAPKAAGFKDFRLRMPRRLVDSIVQHSFWLKLRRDPYYDPDSSRISFGYSEGDSTAKLLMQLGCETRNGSESCSEAESIDLRFYHDSLVEISISSRSYASKNGILSWAWGDFAHRSIELKYGKPTFFDPTLDNYGVDDYPRIPKGVTSIAKWSLPSKLYRGNQRIEVYVYKSDDRTQVSASIDMSDDDLLAREANEEQKKQKELEKKDKIESGF